jgi:hypothetical protein
MSTSENISFGSVFEKSTPHCPSINSFASDPNSSNPGNKSFTV